MDTQLPIVADLHFSKDQNNVFTGLVKTLLWGIPAAAGLTLGLFHPKYELITPKTHEVTEKYPLFLYGISLRRPQLVKSPVQLSGGN